MDKIRIGITIGDINGIGLEVILKTLNNESIYQHMIPVIYGSSKAVSYHKNVVELDNLNYHVLNQGEKPRPGKLYIQNCWNDNVNISLGKMSGEGGRFAMIALDCAVEDLKRGHIDAIVTAPIHKAAMQMAGFKFTGHTEYFANHFPSDQNLMLLVSDEMRVGLVTGHIPLKDVSSSLSKELVSSKLHALHVSLTKDFGIDRPTIAVMGLNPHAGDEGLLGDEEEQFIRPAIIEAKKNGILAFGPFPADGFWGAKGFNKYHGILAMYHDQGLIPFKGFSFNTGVNYTAGLPIIRTSPDHGTAFDIAGKNEADPGSFHAALYLAKTIAQNRLEYAKNRENVLKARPKQTEGGVV